MRNKINKSSLCILLTLISLFFANQAKGDLCDTTKIFLFKADTIFKMVGTVHGKVYNFVDYKCANYLELGFRLGTWDMGRNSCYPTYQFKPSIPDNHYKIYVDSVLLETATFKRGEKITSIRSHKLEENYPIDIFLPDSLYSEKELLLTDTSLNWYSLNCFNRCGYIGLFSHSRLDSYVLKEEKIEIQKDNPKDSLGRVKVKNERLNTEYKILIRTKRSLEVSCPSISSTFDIELLPGQNIYADYPVFERGYSPELRIVPTGKLVASYIDLDTITNYDLLFFAEIKDHPLKKGIFEKFFLRDYIPEINTEYIENIESKGSYIPTNFNIPFLVALIDFNNDFYLDMVLKYNGYYYIMLSNYFDAGQDYTLPEVTYRILNKTKCP